MSEFHAPADLRERVQPIAPPKSLKSKKLVAMLVAGILWKAILVFSIWSTRTVWNDCNDLTTICLACFLTAIVATGGMLDIGYILGQSFVDRYATLGMFNMTSLLKR